MKAEFPGYFPIPSEGEKSAWKNGLFSFDASVLLDLYRYSDETRQELLKLFKSLGPRVWITHQAAQEFLDGRLGVIGSQSKLYDDSTVLIDRIEKMFKKHARTSVSDEGAAERIRCTFQKASFLSEW